MAESKFGLGVKEKAIRAGGFIIDILGKLKQGVETGAGAVALKFPEVTGKKFFTSQTVQKFADDFSFGLSKFVSKATNNWFKAAEDISKKAGETIPVKPIVQTLEGIAKKFNVFGFGMKPLGGSANSQVRKLLTEVRNEFGSVLPDPLIGGKKILKKQFMTLKEAVKLKKRIADTVDFSKGVGPGKGLDKTVLEPARKVADNLIRTKHPDFKVFDQLYSAMIDISESASRLLGISAGQARRKLALGEIEIVEKNLVKTLTRGSSQINSLKQIDKALGTGANFLEQGQKIAASEQFRKPVREFLATLLISTGTIGPLISPDKFTFAPLGAAAGILALTSPRVIGASIRGARTVGRAGRSALGLAPAATKAGIGLQRIFGREQ